MDYQLRSKSLLTNKPHLEHLVTFNQFPVFIGCTDKPAKDDLFSDMIWDICQDTGMIQLRQLIPLDILYSGYHSEAIGGIWDEHHHALSKLVAEYAGDNILEIGGSNAKLAKYSFLLNSALQWSIIEPNPMSENSGHPNITIKKAYFDASTSLVNINTLVHSHVLEHLYDPLSLLKIASENLALGSMHIFSIPNLYQYLKNKFINTLNFEHTCFLTDTMVDELLACYGFEIIEKKFFHDHSIMYVTKKIGPITEITTSNHYSEHQAMYQEFVSTYDNEIEQLNKKIDDHDGDIYLFGAHVFSQFLLNRGINENKIRAILDNSPNKTEKRLYGSTLTVELPSAITKTDNPAVILKAGNYQEEIKQQLLSLNPNVTIWE